MDLAPDKLTAVIACYRDAPAVPYMHQRLTSVFRKLDVDYEIIFVNDASPDDAREVLAELAAEDPAVTVVNHTRNFGSQSAFTSGMRVATGDAALPSWIALRIMARSRAVVVLLRPFSKAFPSSTPRRT